MFLSKRTEADFQAWRDERDWTERKYALWDAGRRLEPPSHGPGKPAHRFRKCPCGEVFDMHGPEAVLMRVPHITETTSTRLDGAERGHGPAFGDNTARDRAGHRDLDGNGDPN